MPHDIPSIRMCMTKAPVSIGREQSVAEADSLMKQHGIRHLPVLDALGNVVGVLSHRALQLVARRWEVDSKMLPVDDLTNHQVYTVSPEAPLDAVCAVMAERHYGCTIVVENGCPIGIFTTTDVCAALASLMRTRSLEATAGSA